MPDFHNGPPEGYDDPKHSEGKGLFKSAAELALTLGAFHVFSKTSSVLLRRGSHALARFTEKTFASKSKTLHSAVRAAQSKYHDPIHGRLGQFLAGRGPVRTGGQYATMGGVLRSLTHMEKYTGSLANKFRIPQYQQAYSNYTSFVRITSNGAAAVGYKEKAAVGFRQLQAFWGLDHRANKTLQSSVFQRMVGRRIHDVQTAYAPTLVGFYIAEKAISFLPMGGHEAKQPNFMNPISVAADFAKFSVGWYPFHMAFGGAIGAAKLLKSGTQYAAAAGAEKIGPHKIAGALKKTDAFVENVLHKAKQTLVATRRSRKYAKDEIPPPWRNPKAWGGSFYETVRHGIGVAARATKPLVRDIKETPFYKNVVLSAQAFADVATHQGLTNNRDYSNFAKRTFVSEVLHPHRLTSAPRGSFLTDVLGLKQAKVGHTEADKAFEILMSSKSIRPWIHQQKLVDTMSDAYLGRNIYEGTNGRIMDLRKYKVGNLLKNTLHNIGKFKFWAPTPANYFMPKAIRIGEIFRFDALTQDRVSALTFGSKVDRDFGFNLGKKIQGANPEAPTFYRPDKDSIGLFMRGRFYNIEKSGRAVELTGEQGKALSRFHLMAVGTGSVLPRNQAARHGYLQDRYMDIEKLARPEESFGAVWPKWKAWVHKNTLRPLEVFDKGESALYKLYGGLRRAAVTPTEYDSISAELVRAMKSTGGTSVGSTVTAIRDLQNMRTTLGRAQIATMDIVNSQDARNVLFSSGLHIPGGKAYTNMGELMDNKNKVVEIARALRRSPIDPNVSPSKIDSILTQIDGQGLKILGDQSSSYGKHELNKLQELQKFIVEETLLRRSLQYEKKGIMETIGEHLQMKGTISKSEKANLRAWDHMTQLSKTLNHRESLMGMVDLGAKPNIHAKIQLSRQQGGREIIDAFEYVHMNKRNIMNSISNIRRADIPFEGYAGLEFIPQARPGRANPYMAIQEVGGSPFLSTAAEVFSPYSLIERFARIGSYLGVGLSPANYKTAQSYFWKGVMGKRAALGAGLFASWQGVDAFTDENPIFDGTMLDEGVNVAISEQFVKHRLRMSKVRDAAGITGVSQWAEGLMPGFTSTIPGAVTGSVIGAATGSVGTIMTLAAAGGLFNRALNDLGVIPDMDKTRDELLEIYSGREDVPVRRGRWWELGRTPYEGGRIAYWRPHWFAKTKAQAMFTPNMRGSKWENVAFGEIPLLGFNPIGTMMDPYHYERSHYRSRPYPETAALGHEMAFIGPSFSATVGKFLKPKRIMHKQELENVYNRRDHWISEAPGVGPNYGPGDWNNWKEPDNYSHTTWGTHQPERLRTMNPAPESKQGVRWTLGEQLYRGTELAGLYGFATETLMGGQPFESDPILANAGEATSTRRTYWNMEMGGILGSSEYLRRFIPRIRTSMDHLNPLKNKMPHWLPGGANNKYFIDFQHGDPYTKIQEGEIRLPGSAYESMRGVRFTFPASASWMGKPIESVTSMMLGTEPPMTEDLMEITEMGTALHHVVQEQLARANLLVSAESKVWDPYTNISGSVDAIIRKDRENIVAEIKTISGEALSELNRPKYAHYSQINTYMKMTGLHRGMVIYVSRDDPTETKTFDVYYSQHRYEKDLAKMLSARQVAKSMQGEGYGRYAFEGYSMLDRLAVLADVAPYSDEYKQALKRVTIQQKLGMIDADQIEQKKKIVKHRKAMLHRYQLYPYRFKGKILSPEEEYNNTTLNENIKAAAEYSLPERILGSLWESFTHLNTPFHTKLIQQRSPIEQYERTRLYGREAAFWSKPMRDFIDPYMTAAVSTNSPVEGAIRGALVSNTFLGGGLGATGLSAAVFGAYGSARGAYEKISGDTYIPKDVQSKREINTYFDKLKYLKAQRLYRATGDKDYADQMGETMTGLYPFGIDRKAWTSMYRSLPYDERPFFDAFLRTSKESERSRIGEIVSPALKNLLQIRWAMKDGSKIEAEEWNKSSSPTNLSQYYKNHSLPGESWAGWHPDVKLDDVKMKTIEKEGLDAHDFGLGWYEQERRIERTPWLPGPINMSSPTGGEPYPTTDVDTFALKQSITQALSQHGIRGASIHIDNIPGPRGNSVLNLRLRAPRTKTIAQFVSSEFARG